MASRGRPRRRRRSGSVAWQIAFEAELRQLPARDQAELLRRARRRRRAAKPSTLVRRPPRIFWVVDPTGWGRHLLI